MFAIQFRCGSSLHKILLSTWTGCGLRPLKNPITMIPPPCQPLLDIKKSISPGCLASLWRLRLANSTRGTGAGAGSDTCTRTSHSRQTPSVKFAVNHKKHIKKKKIQKKKLVKKAKRKYHKERRRLGGSCVWRRLFEHNLITGSFSFI